MSTGGNNLNKTRYTHRDYESIKKDLVNAIPSLTQEWTCREESDPGIVLIKLLSMFGDTLSYNVDKIALELYLQTVTQRKNCAMILRLLGYKMHWYRSAKVVANVRLRDEGTPENPKHVVLNPFKTTFKGGQTTYTVVPSEDNQGSIDISSSTRSERVYLVEGLVNEISFSRNNLVDNRFYFSEDNIDESNLWLDFGGFHSCKLVDNLYLTTDDEVVSFEFNVDEYDKPYIELVNYWEDIIGSSASSESFHLKYIRSDGVEGSVSRNQLSQVVGTGKGSTSSDDLLVIHQSNNSKEIESDDGWTTPGYDPQTVDEAREDASRYITTYDTLVTSADFERASKRVVGVTSSKLVDNEIIINENLDIEDISTRAKDNFTTQEFTDEVSGEVSTLLSSYLAIVYLTYLDLGPKNNFYCSLSDSDPYKFSSYDDFIDGSKEPSDSLKKLGCFPYKPSNNILMSVNEIYRNCKVINVMVEFGTTKVYPFKVAGTLHLIEPLSPLETLSIVNQVNDALEEYYYPDNHGYGEQPKFLDIVETIQNSNDKISYFDAANSITEFNAPCAGLKGFDTTSFAVYTGLSSNFNLDPRFLKFRIKNTGSSAVSLDTLNSVPSMTKRYVINGRSFSTVSLNNIEELKALCEDLKINSSLTYSD